MHNEYMVHAIEGVMVSTKNGILKLLDLFKKGKESHQIFVISPVTDNELSLTGLLERAENKDERLWAVIERSRNSWLELSENSLESDVTSFVTDAINASFAKVEDILKAVWLLEKSSEQSRIYLESMTSFFIASIQTGRVPSGGFSHLWKAAGAGDGEEGCSWKGTCGRGERIYCIHNSFEHHFPSYFLEPQVASQDCKHKGCSERQGYKESQLC